MDHRRSWDTDNKTLRGLFRGTASSSEETRKCEEPAGGKKFTLSDANRQRGRGKQADGKIKACVPLLCCSPTGNQEYKICLESCETGGRGVEFGRKISFFILGDCEPPDRHVPHPPAVGQDNGSDGEL